VEGASEDNIRVVCRVRPPAAGRAGPAAASVLEVPDEHTLLAGGQPFTFDHVAPATATQVRDGGGGGTGGRGGRARGRA